MNKKRSLLSLLKEEDKLVYDYNTILSHISLWEKEIEKKKDSIKNSTCQYEIDLCSNDITSYTKEITDLKESILNIEKHINEAKEQIKAYFNN